MKQPVIEMLARSRRANFAAIACLPPEGAMKADFTLTIKNLPKI